MKFTIRQLRRAGFKVRVIHTRHYETLVSNIRMSGPVTRLSGKGGSTKIQITSPDMQVDAEGIAVCSLHDNFDRKLGNSIALGRAVTQLAEFPAIKALLETI